MSYYKVITDPNEMQNRSDIFRLLQQPNPTLDQETYEQLLPRRVAETRFLYITQYDISHYGFSFVMTT